MANEEPKDVPPLLVDLAGCFLIETQSAPGLNLRGEPTYLEPQLAADLFIAASAQNSSIIAPESTTPNLRVVPSLGSLSAQPLSNGTGRHHRLEADLPEIGAIIDKYRIEELVGVGGFAAVYRATHLLLHTPVAIKLLRPKVLKRKPELAALLCDEARFAARINHPNVVRVNDVTHTPHITYVVIEYVDGGSLADAISSGGRLQISRALRIGIDIAEGLWAGLLAGLIHRDIKPANVLITKSGQAKVADLGLARVQGSEASLLDNKGMVGTPGYMAPEQWVDAQTVDFRADVYSLGVTLYHAMVGEPPFPLRDRQRSLELHRTAPPPRPSDKIAGFPAVVEALLLRMLSKLPSERQKSYPVLLEEMREALAMFPATEPSASARKA